MSSDSTTDDRSSMAIPLRNRVTPDDYAFVVQALGSLE